MDVGYCMSEVKGVGDMGGFGFGVVRHGKELAAMGGREGGAKEKTRPGLY